MKSFFFCTNVSALRIPCKTINSKKKNCEELSCNATTEFLNLIKTNQ